MNVCYLTVLEITRCLIGFGEICLRGTYVMNDNIDECIDIRIYMCKYIHMVVILATIHLSNNICSNSLSARS